jgi:probable rRNA maturation factor
MDLSVTACLGKAYVPQLRRHLRKAAALVPNAPSELSLALINDKTMSQLHLRDMGRAGPTDVLTYELDHDPATGRCVSGEVVICVPEAKRQAKSQGTLVENELLLYALHGVLHLAGFDDRTERSFRKIHTMEDDILTRIGVGPVFSPANSPARTAPGMRPRKRRAHTRSGAD